MNYVAERCDKQLNSSLAKLVTNYSYTSYHGDVTDSTGAGRA